MRSLRFLLWLGLTLMSVAAFPLNAQTSVVLKIPFPFEVRDVTLPPGEYAVTTLTSTVLAIQSKEGRGSLLAFATTSYRWPRKLAPQLIFRRYGNEYFLAEAWWEGHGRALVTSPREIELARSIRQQQIALLVTH